MSKALVKARSHKLLRLVKAIALASLFSVNGADSDNHSTIRLRIVDGATQVPVSRAEILRLKSGAEFESLGFSTNGTFTFVEAPKVEPLQLEVRANQYQGRELSLSITNSRIEAIAELNRTSPFEGVVIAPTGQSANDAKVLVLGKKRGFAMIKPDATIETHDEFPVHLSREGGRFSVGPEDDAESILIVHDLGLSRVSLVGWTNDTRVQLRAWTAAKGRMLINGRPAANQTIVASMVKFPGAAFGVNLQKFETETDPDGNFFFQKLPPGEILLNWRVATGPRSSSFSHGVLFPVDQAFPPDLAYHLHGRDIRGQIIIADGNFDWNADHVMAHLSPKPQPVSEFTPLGVSGPRTYFAVKLSDGKFEATVVPPGTYSLQAQAYGRDNSGQSVEGQVIVPDGDGPIDLGRVTCKRVR